MSESSLTIRKLLLERNDCETNPFIAIHLANSSLLNQVDALQNRCDSAERELSSLRSQLDAYPSKAGTTATAAAIKNEARLRDKLEKLQEVYNALLKTDAQEKALALETAHQLAQQTKLVADNEKELEQQRLELAQKDTAIAHWQEQLSEAQQTTTLAEQQYDGLKQTIRQLQEENDAVKKENRVLEQRVLDDKKSLVDELNTLTSMVEALKREVDMLRSYKAQDEQRSKGGWFGGSSISGKIETKNLPPAPEESRHFGDFGVIVPTEIKQKITAHSMEGMCLRYDPSGTGLLVTSSSDATVKVFDANKGQLRATFPGSAGTSIISCDISHNLVVGAGSDKTCRVWNLRTQRMIHHLVGHAQKITCVRLFGNDKYVLTASSDRSLKVWDISSKTYKQTVTLRHSSTSNCVGVAADGITAVSGHLDGGLRLWNLQSGERIADLQGMHEGSVTSVHFNPRDNGQILTNSTDSSLKLVDIRSGTAIHTFRCEGFQTSHNWSSSAFSPDGRYAIAGSNSSGDVYVWETNDGVFKKKLQGHAAGVCGVGWGHGSQQQVASIDRQGVLILWA